MRWVPFEEVDIVDRARLDAVHSQYWPAAVMHFAAFAYFGESMQDPGKYSRNNLADILALLEALRDHGIDQLIFTSTCATHGVPQRTPITEEHTQQPFNHYGASKQMVERLLHDISTAHACAPSPCATSTTPGPSPTP